MTEIKYVNGDVLSLCAPGPLVVIPHVCNNVGAFGAGFALAVARKYPAAKKAYHAMTLLTLGTVGVVPVDPGNGIWIANMIAQDGLPSAKRRVVIDYDALTDCLFQVAAECADLGAEVHAPKFGCGLAGGKWDRVENIIKQTLTHNRIPVTIYEL
jgi:O-acetyl-ADP-ribose deacetylase (regulator of RNase III)